MEDSQLKEEFQPPSMTMDWQIALVDSIQTLCYEEKEKEVRIKTQRQPTVEKIMLCSVKT